VNCEGKNGIGEQGIEIVHCSVVVYGLWWRGPQGKIKKNYLNDHKYLDTT
jgi:hypothetical protein